MGRAALVLALVSAPALAAAEAPEPEPEPEPRGLLLEGELGFAAMSASQSGDDQLDAIGTTTVGHLGGFLTPRTTLFVLAGISSGSVEDDIGNSSSLIEAYLGAGFRFWITSKLWSEASLSTARLATDAAFGDATFSGARFSLAGGYTIYEGQRLNLDGRLGVSGAGYDADVASSSLWLALGLTNR